MSIELVMPSSHLIPVVPFSSCSFISSQFQSQFLTIYVNLQLNSPYFLVLEHNPSLWSVSPESCSANKPQINAFRVCVCVCVCVCVYSQGFCSQKTWLTKLNSKETEPHPHHASQGDSQAMEIYGDFLLLCQDGIQHGRLSEQRAVLLDPPGPHQVFGSLERNQRSLTSGYSF